MIQVLTRPASPILQDLGMLKCSRTLAFTMTFTKQLSLPTNRHLGLRKAVMRMDELQQLANTVDTLNVTAASVWF